MHGPIKIFIFRKIEIHFFHITYYIIQQIIIFYYVTKMSYEDEYKIQFGSKKGTLTF